MDDDYVGRAQEVTSPYSYDRVVSKCPKQFSEKNFALGHHAVIRPNLILPAALDPVGVMVVHNVLDDLPAICHSLTKCSVYIDLKLAALIPAPVLVAAH